MPTYEYECESCGHTFDLFQKMGTKATKRTCPECKKRSAKRLISSGGGVIFKGSGFYETDYRSDSYRKQAKADTEAASEKKSTDSSSTSSSKKKESKPSSKKSEGSAKP